MNAIIGCRLALSSFDPALFCAAPMPNQKGRLPIDGTSLPKRDFGAHGRHGYSAVGGLNHIDPKENSVVDPKTTDADGRTALSL